MHLDQQVVVCVLNPECEIRRACVGYTPITRSLGNRYCLASLSEKALCVLVMDGQVLVLSAH